MAVTKSSVLWGLCAAGGRGAVAAAAAAAFRALRGVGRDTAAGRQRRALRHLGLVRRPLHSAFLLLLTSKLLDTSTGTVLCDCVDLAVNCWETSEVESYLQRACIKLWHGLELDRAVFQCLNGVGGTRIPCASVALSQLLGFTVSLIKHQAWLHAWPGLADRAAASMSCCLLLSLKESRDSCGQVALQNARKPPKAVGKDRADKLCRQSIPHRSCDAERLPRNTRQVKCVF